MAANVLPVLLFSAAAFYVATSKKKSKKKISKDLVLKPVEVPKVVSNWRQRQEALKFLGSYGICNCDPGTIDGKYGSLTANAIREFQAYAGIKVDGFWGEETERAMLLTLRRLEQEGISEPEDEYTGKDILVFDAECNHVLHYEDELFKIQRKRAAKYALDGLTTLEDAKTIHQEIVEEYAPLCASLGRQGLGTNARAWWDGNIKWIYGVLQEYEALPETLDEDAERFGLK